MADYDLDNAYTIDGPESARDLYGRWAATYDTSFGDGWGYIAPRKIAGIYKALSDGDEPVLDIGAGTGLVAEHLESLTVDGIDITQEMLDLAGAKGLYRNRILGNLLEPLAMADGTYGGVISSGTFTHGHVGPSCLPELLRVCRSGALFVCGCIPPVFDQMGFGSTLAILNARGLIGDLSFRDIPIYEGKDHPHAADRGLVMVFRKS
ncbi:MAG: class I SAM-dependent methyltransferase [Pseudomonadota bacterium]